MTAPAPTPGPWQHWDLHPSVIIGLALLGGLYVYWGGLAAPRRRVASFAAALAVLLLVTILVGVVILAPFGGGRAPVSRGQTSSWQLGSFSTNPLLKPSSPKIS